MAYYFKKQKATLEDLKLELWFRKRIVGSIVHNVHNNEIPINNLSNEKLIHEIKYLEKYKNE